MAASQPVFSEQTAFPICPEGRFVVPFLPRARRKLSLIVPTYREADNIQDFLFELCAVLDSKLPSAYEVIVVDDNSPDRTWTRAAQTMAKLPAVRVMRRLSEQGLASAVVRGYQVAGGEVLGTINADFQHPPQVLG